MDSRCHAIDSFMDRNHDAEGDSPSPELPPDRIHFLLPQGCSDITDKWELEKLPKPSVLDEKKPTKLDEVKAAALNLFMEAAEKPAPSPPITAKVVLPESISVQDLARILGMKSFEVIKAAICLKAFLKATSVLPFSKASEICAVLGVEAQRDGSSGDAKSA
jgi:hypothetical protein